MPQGAYESERFKVIKPLGAGAFGRTLLVADLNRGNEQVVIKVPHDKAKEEALINELIQVATLSASLVGMSHPNIVRCFGFGKYEGYFVMILEYVPGRDLREIIGPLNVARRPLDVKRAVEIVRQACSGLAVAHKINLLHRDIKPENIRIHQENEVPKILDFGISKIMQSSSVGSGTVVGTFPYMSPEALDGRASMASDIWSLSATFYELVTGQLPFWAENLFMLKRKIDKETPAAPKSLNPRIDEHINNIILKGLDKDPRNRFQSAQEMYDALHQDLDGSIAEIRRLFHAEKEGEAERKARGLLETFPNEPRLYMLISEFCNQKLQYLQAETIIRKGMEQCGEHAGLHYVLATLLWNQGPKKAAQAIVEIERALKLGLDKAQQSTAQNLLRRWKEAR